MAAAHVIPEAEAQNEPRFEQMDLFTDYAALQKEQEKQEAELERERKMQKASAGDQEKVRKKCCSERNESGRRGDCQGQEQPDRRS